MRHILRLALLIACAFPNYSFAFEFVKCELLSYSKSSNYLLVRVKEDAYAPQTRGGGAEKYELKSGTILLGRPNVIKDNRVRNASWSELCGDFSFLGLACELKLKENGRPLVKHWETGFLLDHDEAVLGDNNKRELLISLDDSNASETTKEMEFLAIDINASRDSKSLSAGSWITAYVVKAGAANGKYYATLRVGSLDTNYQITGQSVAPIYNLCVQATSSHQQVEAFLFTNSSDVQNITAMYIVNTDF